MIDHLANQARDAASICNPPWQDPPHIRRHVIGWQSQAWLAAMHEWGEDAPRRMARAVLAHATTTALGFGQLLPRKK